MVDRVEDDGPGSLRAAIEAANALSPDAPPVRIQIRLPAGAVIEVPNALPAISAPGLHLDGGGALLRGLADCARSDGRFGCDGIVVRGPGVVVSNLRATGFLFDGFAVRGAAAVDVTIRGCVSFENSDDGFGVSDHARGVKILNCVAMDNGFRTKGKGILVFDDAEATSEGNQLLGNRDGFTVSRRAEATLIDTAIVGSYDKGMGAAGATLHARDTLVAANGLGGDGQPVPNGDGLRATLGSVVDLVDTTITGNGDAGMVVLGTARVSMRGGRVTENGGAGVIAGDHAQVELRAVDLHGNRGETVVIAGPNAKVRRDR